MFKIFYCVIGLMTYAVAWGDLTVEDYQGNKLTLEKPANRIIVLAPHIVENVFSAGAGEKLVGVVAYSDFPEAAKRIERVGGYNTVSVEKILSLKPDLVINWVTGHSIDVTPKLKALGIPVYHDHPKTLEDVMKSIKDIGVLAGTTRKAQVITEQYEKRLRELKQDYARDYALKILYQVWHQPLRTLNGSSIISNVMTFCGGVNPYAGELAVAPIINIESVIKENPKIIFSSGTFESDNQWLAYWQKWPMLDAVKNQHLFRIPPEMIQRHTVRILDGVDRVCRHMQDVAHFHQKR